MESLHKLSFYKLQKKWKLSRAESASDTENPQSENMLQHEVQQPVPTIDEVLNEAALDIEPQTNQDEDVFLYNKQPHSGVLIDIDDEPEADPPQDQHTNSLNTSQVKTEDSLQNLEEESILNNLSVEFNLGDIEMMPNPEDVLDTAQQWLQRQNTTISDLPSFDSFIRGAIAAPHSSELDLASLSDDDAVQRVAILNSQQLVAEVTKYTNTLRMLLNEVHTRQQMRLCNQSMEYVQQESSIHSMLPIGTTVRIVDNQTVTGTLVQDQQGKGRGRLRPRSGIIGIGQNGRPFLL